MARLLLILLALCGALAVASARKCKSPPPKHRAPPLGCKGPEARCSLYNSTCCPGHMCIMTPKCTQLAGPAACQPTCQKRVSVVLKRVVLPSGLAVWEAGRKSAPAVVVLQEWWGVNEAIKETAYYIGQQGYRVAIPDLYGGEFVLGVNSSHAVLLSMKLNWTQAITDMTNTVEYLRSTGSSKVAVTGFCQGGGLALCAAQFSGVVAAAPFYGAPSNTTAPQCKVDQIKVPVQYHWGELDPSSTNFNNTANRMAAAGVDVVKYIYQDAPHAFMNFLTPLARAFAILGGRPTPPEAEIKLAFARLTDFLAKHLLNK